MTSGEFQNLRATFERLLAASDSERVSILNEISAQDAAQAAELSRMLAAHEKNTSLLDEATSALIAERAASPTPVRDGLQIGPYRIEKQIGAGGMGIVYLASRTDGAFERLAAIKILRHDRADGLFVSRFRQERRILAQLDHPHIASVLDAGETPQGDPYFVMEYVDGIPITAYCEQRGLATEQRLDLFLQVCDAVQYAHRNLTVHRDLKPGNVLVTEAAAVKLLDFGIAKLLEDPQNSDAEAPPSVVLLTPEYSSPEQIRREAITTATDVFALGILLYELLSGEHPFRGKGRLPHEVMRAICEETPPPPSAVAIRGARHLEGDLDTITLTALRGQPEWRYPSVEMLAEDLRRHRQGWPILARGDRRWYRIYKFARRQWAPLTAAALLMVFLTTGIVAATYQARRADRARAIAEVERARAEAAQGVALEQRRVAEARTREAELERQKERERYRDVRSLASSLLFDVYDGVRDLAGSETARRVMVAKAQHQLELLEADGGNEIGLQRDLAACYERMGELRVDPGRAGKKDAEAALDSYQKAVNLRQEIVRRADSLPSDRRDLALSLAALGEGELKAGDTKRAAAMCRRGWDIARSLIRTDSSDRSMRRALGSIDERRCVVLLVAGDTAGALQSCQEGITILTPLAGGKPEDVAVERWIASAQGSFANALRLLRKPQEAEAHARLALDTLRKLELLAPSNAEYRRLASTAEVILASSMASSGRTAASLDTFRQSVQDMQVAIEIDPNDLGSALRLSLTLLAFSSQLRAINKDAAHETAKEAMDLLERTANRSGAGAVEWNEYADALLKSPWPDLRQSARALELARKAVAASSRKNPFFLDTLAWAYFRTGKASDAVGVEQEALRLLPAGSTGGLHDELEHGVKTFLGEAGEKF